VSGRTCSSAVTVTVPRPTFASTGNISAARRSVASAAFCCDSSAKRSCSSRPMSYRSTRFSAVSPITSPDSGSSSPSRYIASTASVLPSRCPSRMSGSRNGTRVMFSMPPARTTSESPNAICCAASWTAFMPEPHAMLTL
jgi:hypothetical protein